MKKRNYITLIIILFLTMQFSSCNFVDKDGNKVKINFIKEDNFLEDEKLENMLDQYNTALPTKETQSQNLLNGYTKAKKIATKITRYIESRVTQFKETSKECLRGVEDLKQYDAKLDGLLQELLAVEKKKDIDDEAKYTAIKLGGTLGFGKFPMYVIGIRMGCTFSIETIQ